MATYHITELEWPKIVHKDDSTTASGLNNSSIVVGYSAYPDAMYWSPDPNFLPVPFDESYASAINDNGDIVGIWDEETIKGPTFQKSPPQAFLFRNGTSQDLASVFGAEESMADDINDAGIIAASAGKLGQMHAFRYDSNTAKAVDLGGLPGADESRARAINNKGQITGESSSADTHAFLWDGKLIDLGLVFSSNDINDSGVIVGSRVFPGASERTAFRYPSANNNPQFEDLGSLPLRGGFVGSHARAINNNGDIVGSSWTKDGPGQMTRAFVRKAGGLMQDLTSLIPHISGWLLTQATDINDKGEIIGNGVLNGNHRGFLLTPLSLSVGIDRYYQAIDPMALILSSRIYQIWVQIHHPHEIKVSEIKEVLQSMAPAERTAVLNRARRFADLGKAVEEAFEELKE